MAHPVSSALRRVLLATVSLVAMTLPATADTTFTVSTTSDSGAGSLRQAIIDSNAAGGSNSINFTIGGTFTLASELPVITAAVAINGNGNTPIISGNNNYRVFFVNAGASAVSFSNLTIADGRANGGNGGGGGGGGMGAGGAIFAMSGNITLTDVGLSGNVANGGNGTSGVYGGGGGLGGAGGSGFNNPFFSGGGGGIGVAADGGTRSAQVARGFCPADRPAMGPAPAAVQTAAGAVAATAAVAAAD